MQGSAASVASNNDHSVRNTVLILLWAFFAFVWSIFAQPYKTFPARTVILQPLWILRIYVREATWTQDLLLFLCLHALYTFWQGYWRLFSLDFLCFLDLRRHVVILYLETFGLLGGCGAFAGSIVYRGHRLKAAAERREAKAEQMIDEQVLPPFLIPSRTAHSRLFPEKHAFSYTYLFVGIPVGIKGTVGSALSVDSRQQNWFHVRSSDYLARGGAHLGLADKLKRYLHTQGVTDRDYAFAYLVTAPRFLGYSFNPVSFWYLYDSDTVLQYMILEVNNTFDERRMYLLRAENTQQNGDADTNGHHPAGPKDSSKKMVFTDVWTKDFHVSPFNSRKGSYSLRAADPLGTYQETGHVRIDNAVVLRSSKDHVKMTARVWSEGQPCEAGQVHGLELARFILRWWWIGLATFPRIVWEAGRLFFQRKLYVWFRPEVVDTSIGRNYTSDEVSLEMFFQAFLKDAVERSKEAIRVNYEPAHSNGEEIVFYSPGFTYEEDPKKILTIQVLSPAFYSRFVHYAHTKEAFDREGLATDEKNKTLNIKNTTLLPILLRTLQNTHYKRSQKSTFSEHLKWALVGRLRCPPPDAVYPHHIAQSDYTISDIRSPQQSESDRFVKSNCSDSAVYRRIATKLFLAQRFAFGIPVLISAFDLLVRASLIGLALYFCDKWREVDVLRPREHAPKRLGAEDVRVFAVLLLLANAVQFWSFLKA